MCEKLFLGRSWLCDAYNLNVERGVVCMVMLHSLCHTVWMTLDLYSVSPRKCLSQGGHCPKRGGGHFGGILLKDANLHLLNKLFI